MKKGLYGALLLSLLALVLYGAVTSHGDVHETCKSEWKFKRLGEVHEEFTKVK